MEQSSCETHGASASEEIPRILRSQNILYRVHNTSPIF